MEILLLAVLPAVFLWGGIVVTRVSMVAMAAMFLLATACVPSEFFSFKAGGLTWTVDRLIVLAMLAALALGWKAGKVKFSPLESVDYLMGLFLIWLTARTITQPLGSILPNQPHTLMHMINGYCIPFALYFYVRCIKLESKDLRSVFWLILIMGIYLGCTAIFEVAKIWSLVFPKFIADPTLGIHFGRARGPMLQSVRLGVCLLSCFTAVVIYTIWLNPFKRTRWILAAATIPMLTLAIGLTYTRSIWMGLLAILAILVLLCLKGTMRKAMITGGALAGIVGGLILGPNLVAFKREYSAAETRESTYMRAAFAYVSLEMFKERPIAGFGFNQFNVANRPFLSDRSTEIRVESIRGYVHHNSYLSLLVDLGIVGFFLFGVMLIGFIRESWQLWKSTTAPDWARGLGLTALCLTSVHLIQMAFHEVSFSSIENGILFGSFGLVLAARRIVPQSDSEAMETPVD